MRARWIGLVCLVVMLGAGLSGCSCITEAVKGEAAPPPAAPPMAAPPEAKKEMAVPGAPAEAPPPAMAMLKDIHFDFDRYNIRPTDADLLKEDYSWFQANPGARVRIEGNCDERGTIEYNLALGQKRADEAKSFLVNLGVAAGSLDTVSYGKERPLDPGHNEEAWAKNRRDHLEPLK